MKFIYKKRHLITLFIFTGICLAFYNSSYPPFLLDDEKNTIGIFEKTSTKVVNISNLQLTRTSYYSYDEVPAGNGSGFVWDEMGHIVTNFHVVQGASKLMVSLSDGRTFPARVIGTEPRKDIAVLGIISKEPLNLIGVPKGDSSQLLVGQKAVAIGSPFGFDQSMSKGIISAIGRSILGIGQVHIKDMIQTDTSINPGNSGGPLLDSRGYLIGMNTMIYSKSGTSAGIGFAVPVNTIVRAVNQIIKYGKVKQPGFGLEGFQEDVNRQLGISGFIIKHVGEGSTAAQAGLRSTKRDGYGNILLGDIITEIDGKKIENYDDLYNALESKEIGTSVSVKITRDIANSKKQILTLQVKLMDVNGE